MPTLAPGERLGPYEILSPLGAGGMGEVYKGRDTRLDRIVALKVSKAEFSERFEREARAISALNHPHICQLYDVGPNYLVMEYIEGSPLKGPLPLRQALEYAAQICDALDAAHRKGITHRDLKPANILVAKGGIKLLDFGLAKMGQASKPLDDATVTMALTGKNVIVGTLYYMSPEQLQAQATGKEIDFRSDIFSFGLVLYEMLTGKRAFDGASAASVIAAIMERPAPSIAEVAPPALDAVLARCLMKDPDDRWQSARDLKAALGLASATPAAAASQDEQGRSRRLPWAIAAAAALGALALGGMLYFRRPAEDARVIRFNVQAPPNTTLSLLGTREISPDGRSLAFSAGNGDRDRLWVRDLDALSARPLEGTEGASNPFWSPDSRFLGFLANGKLKTIDAKGGPVQTLCDAITGTDALYGSWGSRGLILFSGTGDGLLSVPASGGAPTRVTTADKGSIHDYPSFLPDGRHFLYTETNASGSELYLADLDAGDRLKSRRGIQKLEMSAATNPAARFAWPGFLLFVRARSLLAVPFDEKTGRVTGDAAQVATGLDRFAVSQNGILVYAAASAVPVQLTWFDRSGKPDGTVGMPGGINGPAISPDGHRVAHDSLAAETSVDVWIDDLARGTESRFTFSPRSSVSDFPVWSPGGNRIAFRRAVQETSILEQTIDSTREEVLDESSLPKFPQDWSRDGKYIIEQVTNPDTNSDIFVIPLEGDKAGNPFPFLQGPFNETWAKLSPGGKWLAYTSDETNRNEVYVQEFAVTPAGRASSGGAKWQISTSGGSRPVWSRDGRQLFFLSPDLKMMAVDIKSGPKFDPGAPKALFDTHISGSLDYWFDVAKDGRFLIPVRVQQTASEPLSVVVNWPAALRK